MTSTTEEVWFVLLQGEELGPLSFEDVLDFYYKDVVTSESFLWREGWSEWVSIVQVPEFNELLFQGMVVTSNQPEQNFPESLVGDTAFLGEDELNHLRNMSSAQVKVQSTKPKLDSLQRPKAVEMNAIPDAPVEELEELEELDSGIFEKPALLSALDDLGSSKQANHSAAPVLASNLRSARVEKKTKSSGGLTIVLVLLLLGGGVAAWLKPWESKVVVSTPKEVSSISSSQETINTLSTNSRQIQPINQGNHGIVDGQANRVADLNNPTTPDNGLQSDLSKVNQNSNGIQLNSNQNIALPTPTGQEDQIPAKTDMKPIEANSEALALPQIVENSIQGNQGETIEEEQDQDDETLEIDTVIELKQPQKKKTSKKRAVGKRRPTKTKAKSSKKSSKKQETNKAKANPKSSASNKPVTLRRDVLLGVLKKESSKFSSCQKKDANLKGIVSVTAVINRNGTVASSSPSSSKLRKSAAKNCILSVVNKLKFPSYTGDLMRVPLSINLK